MIRKLKPWYVYVVELGGVGHLPIAPGTWGSLGSCVVYVGLHQMGLVHSMLLVGLTVLVLFGSIPLCDWASLYLGQQDPNNIVLDEFVGQWIALFPILWLEKGSLNPYLGLLISFFLFRFFDVLNVVPINLIERLQGGWGIVLDDVMAGIYVNISLILVAGFFLT